MLGYILSRFYLLYISLYFITQLAILDIILLSAQDFLLLLHRALAYLQYWIRLSHLAQVIHYLRFQLLYLFIALEVFGLQHIFIDLFIGTYFTLYFVIDSYSLTIQFSFTLQYFIVVHYYISQHYINLSAFFILSLIFYYIIIIIYYLLFSFFHFISYSLYFISLRFLFVHTLFVQALHYGTGKNLVTRFYTLLTLFVKQLFIVIAINFDGLAVLFTSF